MPEFAIVCDSSCELSPELCRRLGIELVSQRLSIAGDELLDRNMSDEDAQAVLRAKARARVTAPGRDSFEATFDELVDRGIKEIVVPAPSAAILETYDSAVEAASQYVDTHITVLDTKTISGQLTLVVLRLVADRLAGMLADEAIKRAEELAAKSRLLMLLPPGIDLDRAYILGDVRGFRRSLKTLGMLVSGGWIYTRMNHGGSVRVERRSDSVDLLAGNLARRMSTFSQHEGPLTYLETHSLDTSTLTKLRKPLNTNEFEHVCAASLPLRPTTMVLLGMAAAGIAYAPQSLISADEICSLLEEEKSEVASEPTQ